VKRERQTGPSGQPSASETAWWKRIVGVFKDDPEFEKAMRLGREYRRSLREEEEAEETG
jgi:hypothetical protein